MPLFKGTEHNFCNVKGCPQWKKCARHIDHYGYTDVTLSEFDMNDCQFFEKI